MVYTRRPTQHSCVWCSHKINGDIFPLLVVIPTVFSFQILFAVSSTLQVIIISVQKFVAGMMRCFAKTKGLV